jgi:hypothetical protein
VAAIGAALVYAQGAMTSVAVPEPLDGVLQVALLVLPPLLIGRGLGGLFRHSRMTRWAQRVLRAPLANALMPALGGSTVTSPSRRPALDSAHTEVVLAHAAEALYARRPATAREALRHVPAAAAAFAREADRLRVRDGILAAAVRAAGLLDTDAWALALGRIGVEREGVRPRLATAIAALDAIRIDLRGLDRGHTAPGIIAQLEIVRELQRQVDARAEVRSLPSPPRRREHTPA